MGQGLPKIDPAILGGLIAILVVTGLAFFIVMMYVSSVMRFILFDSVLSKACHIRQGWARRQGPGWKYFLWQLGYLLVTMVGIVVLVGIPAAFAYAMGWFSAPREHVPGLVLGGIVVFFLASLFFLLAAVVHVLTKDFVVPQMALDGVGAVEGWRRLWPMIHAEQGGYAVYVLMKIVLAIGAGIAIGVVSLILLLILAIPAAAYGNYRCVDGKDRGPHLECFYHHRSGGGGLHSAGGVSLSDGPDLGPGHCLLSGVCDLFLRATVSGVELGALSTPDTPAGTAALGACPGSGGIGSGVPHRGYQGCAGRSFVVFPWGHEKRRPTIHFTMRWSVEPVAPMPTPKLNSHCGPKSTSMVGKICCC